MVGWGGECKNRFVYTLPCVPKDLRYAKGFKIITVKLKTKILAISLPGITLGNRIHL